MAPRTVKTSHGEAIGPLQAAELLRARRIAKGKTPLTPEEEAQEAARKAGESTAADALPLGKVLASTEKKIRDGGIRSLAAFLSRPTNTVGVGAQSQTGIIPPDEMAKLWKGIFYCFWMSDKPLVQQALATELADLVLIIAKGSSQKRGSSSTSTSTSTIYDLGRVQSALAFLQGFWAAMAREWPLIDKHRVDKYYLLMRRFTGAGFRLCQYTGWDTSIVAQMNQLLTLPGPSAVASSSTIDPEAAYLTNGGPGPLAVQDVKLPDSISYHVCDILLDELSKTLSAATAESETVQTAAVPLVQVFEPIFSALNRASLNKMFDRILQASLHPLAEDLRKALELLDLVAGDDDDVPADRKEAEEEMEDFDIEELWEAIDHAPLLRSVLAFDMGADEDEDANEAQPASKRARLSDKTKRTAVQDGSTPVSASLLLARARQFKLDLFLHLRSSHTSSTPPTPAPRARSLESYIQAQLGEDDPELETRRSEEAAETLTPAQKLAAEKKRRQERAKAKLARKKRNVEMQAAIQRNAAARKMAKKSRKAEAAKQAKKAAAGPVVIGPALSKKLGRKRK
ncbi:hypothetical protein OC845_001382 [Tilletia horrida]|nr:hypothetical protein OC845_001382 [Tilletia horrida]